jgi:hypothetical protein
MSIFGKILDKLGLGKRDDAPNAAPARPAPAPTPSAASPSSAATATRSSAPAPIAVVDVANSQKLNWRTSIVDLLKLLDIDSSFEARKELATELGVPPELMKDSAKMNMWLHKTVLEHIAMNGGNVPKDLLD